jgi:K+ transporter
MGLFWKRPLRIAWFSVALAALLLNYFGQGAMLLAKPGASAPNRFYMYGVIARLAMVAASYELEATDPDAEIYD